MKENPSAFLMADYYGYSFSVSNKGKTDAEFEADKKAMLEKAGFEVAETAQLLCASMPVLSLTETPSVLVPKSKPKHLITCS